MILYQRRAALLPSIKLKLLCRVVVAGASLGLLPAWAATPVHLPYLQDMHPDRVTIVWSTRENLSGEVRYSTEPNLTNFTRIAFSGGQRFAAAATRMSNDFYQYRSYLVGLTAGTVYYYQILMAGQDITADGGRQFKTPDSGPFRFLVFGDSGAATPEQRSVLLRMLTETPDLVLHVGDIAYESGTFDEFTNNHFGYYFPMMKHLPFFPAPGNHEYYTSFAAPYLALHSPPTDTVPEGDLGRYYSFDWNGVHFVALDANLLDTTGGHGGDGQLNWLESDLAATTAKWKIVYWHQVPYALFHHADDLVDIAAAKFFVPIVERHGVQLVLTGHEHEYFRSKPMRDGVPVSSGPSTVYITSGGGGGPLHPVISQPWVESGCTYPAAMESAATARGINLRPPDARAAGLCEASWWQYLRVDVDSAQITVRAIDLNGIEFDKTTITIPAISPGGIVNTASYTPDIAPGGLVSIFGQALSGTTAIAQQYPLPLALGGTTVSLNGTPLPLFYVSPTQINAQLPMNFVGTGTLRVATTGGVSDSPTVVSTTAPAVFASGILHHSNGVPVSSSSPAIAGEILDVYLTGLGQVNGSLAVGQAAPSNPPLSVTSQVTVDGLGSKQLPPIFSGLTPGLAGVYQVSVAVPKDLPANTYPIRIVSQGVASNTEVVQVKNQLP